MDDTDVQRKLMMDQGAFTDLFRNYFFPSNGREVK